MRGRVYMDGTFYFLSSDLAYRVSRRAARDLPSNGGPGEGSGAFAPVGEEAYDVGNWALSVPDGPVRLLVLSGENRFWGV